MPWSGGNLRATKYSSLDRDYQKLVVQHLPRNRQREVGTHRQIVGRGALGHSIGHEARDVVLDPEAGDTEALGNGVFGR
jgi:hypothetical protein